MELNLPELRALCENATEGPWHAAPYREEETGVFVLAARTDAGPLPGNPTRGAVAFVPVLLEPDLGQKMHDVLFIAEAREALPKALDEIEWLRTQVRNLKTQVKVLRSGYRG